MIPTQRCLRLWGKSTQIFKNVQEGLKLHEKVNYEEKIKRTKKRQPPHEKRTKHTHTEMDRYRYVI